MSEAEEARQETSEHQTDPRAHMGVFAELLGAWYPRDYIVAVIDDLGEAERASDELVRSGVPAADVRIFPSEQVVEGLRLVEAHRSLVQRIGAAVQREISEEGAANKDYNEDVRSGRHLLTVMAVEPDEIERARQVLVAHGARRIMHYRKYTLTDLR